jgi:hypothetical protein
MNYHLAYFITGHGFGHATRSLAMMESLPAEVELSIYTSSPEWLFRNNLDRPFDYNYYELDIGTVQKTCLHCDQDETLVQFSELWNNRHDTVAEISERLQREGVRGVMIDSAPLAMEIAFAASLPSAVTTNFTWDWIYGPYIEERPQYAHLIDEIQLAHSRVNTIFRLGYYGQLEGFQSVMPVGHLVRKPRNGRMETLNSIGADAAKPQVLISFGGLGAQQLPLEAIGAMKQYQFHIMQDHNGDTPDNLFRHDSKSVFHPDVVHAADLVLGKLGYGLVTECIAGCTPLLFVPRSGFLEHKIFEEELPKTLPIQALDEEEFFRGEWHEAIEAMLPQCTDACGGVNLDGAGDILKLLPRIFPGWTD